jgi:hypothetical protein
VRDRKLPNGKFGDQHLRVEWTFKNKQTITSRFRGNKFEHLLNVDHNDFINKNLKLEKVEYIQLTDILGITPAKDWAANLKLRVLAYDSNFPLTNGCLWSPANVRSILKDAGYSRWDINKCFGILQVVKMSEYSINYKSLGLLNQLPMIIRATRNPAAPKHT